MKKPKATRNRKIRIFSLFIFLIFIVITVAIVNFYINAAQGAADSAVKIIETTHKISEELKSKDLKPLDSIKKIMIKDTDSTRKKD